MDEQGSSNWFGSWINAAKNKSSVVFEFVKKDLGEFGSAVKNEASYLMSNTSSTLGKSLKLDEPNSTANSMKKSISSFWGQMNEALSPTPDDSDTEAIMIVEGQETITLTKLQKVIYDMQKNEDTFLKDPDKSLKQQYDCWLEIIEDQMTDDRLTKHISSSLTLKNQYTKLVPLKVEHGLFWKRYLFKRALLEDDMARQEAFERREVKEKEFIEENVQWEKEDFANDIELTEEEQTTLLEQYENETKEKEKPNTNNSVKQENTDKSVDPNEKKSTRKLKNSAEKSLFEEFQVADNEKSVINKTDDDKSINMHHTPSSSSGASSDGDWDKVPELDK